MVFHNIITYHGAIIYIHLREDQLPGPLDGIKIIEFTQIIAAPFGGMLLADMGAEIIKIEPLSFSLISISPLLVFWNFL